MSLWILHSAQLHNGFTIFCLYPFPNFFECLELFVCTFVKPLLRQALRPRQGHRHTFAMAIHVPVTGPIHVCVCLCIFVRVYECLAVWACHVAEARPNACYAFEPPPAVDGARWTTQLTSTGRTMPRTTPAATNPPPRTPTQAKHSAAWCTLKRN